MQLRCEKGSRKVGDLTAVSSLPQMMEASLYDKIMDQQRLEPEFFRVGFYGKKFPFFLRVSRVLFCFHTSNIKGVPPKMCIHALNNGKGCVYSNTFPF